MPIELANNNIKLIILPEYGGMINNFFTNDGTDILWGYSEEEVIDVQVRKDFRNVKLSPYPNRISGGEYNFEGQKHCFSKDFDKNTNSIHGFLFDKQFAVKLLTQTQCTLCYSYNGEISGYPFLYDIIVNYTLLNFSLICETKLFNAGNTRLPIGDGFHPYFNLGCDVNDIELQLPEVRKLEVDKNLIPTGKTKNFYDFGSPSLINETSFDTAFEIVSEGAIATTNIKKGSKEIFIKQEIGSGKYNYLQVFTSPDRKTLAVEPMTCAPNAFNNGMGLITLEPGEHQYLSFEIGCYDN